MISKISEGIEISIETYYQADYSNPLKSDFMFAYRITIDNLNPFTVQLISRCWNIYDSNGEQRNVEGEGVVGEQPVLKQGEHFTYTSGCHFNTEIGKMYGYYIMENQNSKQRFKVNIPPFNLIVPAKLN